MYILDAEVCLCISNALGVCSEMKRYYIIVRENFNTSVHRLY